MMKEQEQAQNKAMPVPKVPRPSIGGASLEDFIDELT